MLGQVRIYLITLCFLLPACWPKTNKAEESQLDAITAASKRIFGKNVRGYMWALTTDSPSIFAQAPSPINSFSSASPVAVDPFENSAPNPYKTEFFQCWYYAETAVYEKLEGPGLKALFLDKTKTKGINNNFIDVKHFFDDLERSEMLRHFESFALSALPGTCFLFNAVGPLKGKTKGALTNAFCSISLASLGASRKPSSDGWGSDKAREHIQNQLKAKVDELHEVNWEVLAHLKNKLAEFNSAKKFSETTQVQCPSNELWVAELMGPTSAR